MKRIMLIAVILQVLTSFVVSESVQLKQTEQWKNDRICGFKFCSMVNTDGELIASFFKTPNLIISSNKVTEFAPYGMGPGDLMDTQAMFLYKGELAVVESPNKMKVFKKKGGTYAWKDTVWLERGKLMHKVKDALYLQDKLFAAGFEMIDFSNDALTMTAGFLNVLDGEGKILKKLVQKKYNYFKRYDLMDVYLATPGNDRVFLLKEDELKVYVITTNKLELSKEVSLKAPAFYKKIPPHFYVQDRKDKKKNKQRKNIFQFAEEFALNYSRITGVGIDGKYLAVQVRTCDENLKKFAVLLYDTENFKLMHTLQTDDFLLAVKDGKYYCFANGNPGRDDGTDDFIINIYKLSVSR
jgi:hypothetical protein